MEKDFFTESIEFYNATKKLSTFEIQSLNHPFLERIPKYLYKYRKSGEAGRIEFYVGKRSIYTASLDRLNDVFEGITPSTENRIKQSTVYEMCRYYKNDIIQILNKRFPSFDPSKADSVFDIFLEEHFDENAIYERAKGYVTESEQKELKEVMSAITYLFKKLDEKEGTDKEFENGMKMLMNTNKSMGAFCMCDSCLNENLWALYADDFAGYCIEYDLRNPCKSKGSILFVQALYPVIYVDKKDDDWFKPLFESTLATINIDGKGSQFDSQAIFDRWFLKTVCSKKKEKWSNEGNEWRYFGKANTGRLGPLVSSVIIGHKINKHDFEEIQFFANKNGFPIKITDLDYINKEVVVRDLTEEDAKKINERV